MTFGRRFFRLHDLVFLGLAAVVVYPDEILHWLSDATGRLFGWGSLILLEVVAIGLLIGAVVIFQPHASSVQWWTPLYFVGLVSVFRAVMWGLKQAIGFGED